MKRKMLMDRASHGWSFWYAVELAASLSWSADAQVAVLAWDPTPSPEVLGYNVYQGPASHTYTNVLNAGAALWTQIGGVPIGQTNYFVVTAYNDQEESGPSNEVEFAPILKFLGSTITMQSDGRMQVHLAGPMGLAVVVQMSTNCGSWKPVSTNTLSANDGTVTFTENPGANTPMRLYRAYLIDNSGSSSPLIDAITSLK